MKKDKNKFDKLFPDSIDDDPKISRVHSEIELWLPYNSRSGLHVYFDGGCTLF